MEVIWAPWRMDYILQTNKPQGCIFCVERDEAPEVLRDRLILYVGDHSLIIMNRYPYSNGHLLVAPLRHAGALEDLTEAESADLMRLTRSCVCVLKEVMNPGGFNVGINLGGTAGAGVEEHLHVHIVPRWEGDNNFMAVVADTRVIPEHLKITYDKLLPRFHALNAGGKK